MVDIPAEVRLAQRLVERRALRPPIDVEGILLQYANVEYVDFPVEIDGLCLNLKMTGKRPTVLVSKTNFELRRRFTLAHELGHVLIPWHVGTIIDEIDTTDFTDDNYFAVEAEANRFASELLMPTKWVGDEIRSCENPLDALFRVFIAAEVSLQAASIKFVSCLPPNYVIASSKGGRVDWSSRSEGTLAGIIPRGTDLNSTNPFPFSCNRWTKLHNGATYNLWGFDVVDEILRYGNNKPWREILDEIVCEIIPSAAEQKSFEGVH